MNKIVELAKRKLDSIDQWHHPFFMAVLLFSLYLTYLILQPFAHTIILAIVLASLFYPLQVILVRILRGRKNLAALINIFLITFVIIIPTLLFISALISQGVQSINQVNDWVKAGNLQVWMTDPRLVGVLERLREYDQFFELGKMDIQGELLRLSKAFAQFLVSRGAALLGDLALVISRFFIMMFITFYLVRDGAEMVEKIKYLAPLREDQEDRIIQRIRAVARSALLGSFLTALVQGIVGGIGLMLVGIPGLFWGTMMGFSSLIPIVGTAFIWVPAVLYLVLLSHWKAAVFLTLWCALINGSIDNFLRPFIMRGQAQMSPFYVFLAIIGGVQYFGLAGILYGPLILAFAMVMLYIYQDEYRDHLVNPRECQPLPPRETSPQEAS